MMAGRQSQIKGRARLGGLLTETRETAQELEHERHRFDEMAGAPARVVVADQLFPTPPDLARRLIGLARSEPGHRILEPSAGTGNLLAEMADTNKIVAVEISLSLSEFLTRRYPQVEVHCCDFLNCGEELGLFDRIVMNPPFTMRSDVKHIQHARKFLKRGGRLVAICMNGAQRGALRDEASEWIDLPAGSFRDSGTSVDTAIVVFDN